MPASVVSPPSFQFICNHAVPSRCSTVAEQHSVVSFNPEFQLKLERNLEYRPKSGYLNSSCRPLKKKYDFQQINSSSPPVSKLALARQCSGSLGVFFGSSASFAISLGQGTALAVEEASSAQGGVAEPTDYILVFLFGAALVGLVLLTGGVIYLSVSDFLEKRQLTELQNQIKEEKFDNDETVKVGGPRGFGPIKKVEKGK